VGTECGLVALLRECKRTQAGIGEPKRVGPQAWVGRGDSLDQSGTEELNFEGILAWPAGGAKNLAKTPELQASGLWAQHGRRLILRALP
jgi:hypothetical protein